MPDESYILVLDTFRQDHSGPGPYAGMEGLQDFYSDGFMMYTMKVRPHQWKDNRQSRLHHSDISFWSLQWLTDVTLAYLYCTLVSYQVSITHSLEKCCCWGLLPRHQEHK